MMCPFCGSAETIVIDSRVYGNKNERIRRRECCDCKKRFTTREYVDKRGLENEQGKIHTKNYKTLRSSI